jgi:hypothetical protein
MPSQAELKRVLDLALDEVVMLSMESCRDLDDSPEQSSEWYMHRGEILAYGRVTAALIRLEECQD